MRVHCEPMRCAKAQLFSMTLTRRVVVLRALLHTARVSESLV